MICLINGAEYALEIVKVKIAEDGKFTKFYRPKRKAEILEKNHYSE